MMARFYPGHLIRFVYVILAVAFIAQATLSSKLDHWIHPASFENQGYQIEKNVPSTFRAVSFLGGLRLLASHIFWIKVLVYYGDAENSLDHYSQIYPYCSLATDLNPYYIPSYQFGASVLAFHVKRVEEAVKLLQKGIEANPRSKVAPLVVLLAAIGYQNVEKYDQVIPRLEALINSGNAPRMMVNILANIYKKVGRYDDAIALWRKILKNAEVPQEKIEAAQKLQELYLISKPKKATGQ
jgi:tetratricopeptide (TPR) repeat protein